MANQLYQQLLEKYPRINDFDRVSGYPPPNGLERISLILKSEEFAKARKELITIPEIKDIAEKVFDDVAWKFYEIEGTLQNAIVFDSSKPPVTRNSRQYAQKYDNHLIQILSPFYYPSIELSLGWRGNSQLHSKQREKYFSFINSMYDKFLENAKK